MIFQTFGTIQPVPGSTLDQSTLAAFLNQIITLIYTLSGLFVLFNLILAGYGYLTSNGDPQKIANAGAKILQSLMGLFIVAISFVVASILGYLLFKDTTALIKPSFYFIK